MTAASVGAGHADSYAAYLESRTKTPARGDYYLSPTGEPTEAKGVWHLLAETRERLGIADGEAVSAKQLVALMEGRHPGTGEFIRRAGADGRRAGGIDLTFSAPKSVSVVWALGSPDQRAGIEEAHGRAVTRALAHLRAEIPVVREGAGGHTFGSAHDVLAAEFRHTTARGVAGAGAPDPQLHSHVVVTGVVRGDSQFAAVASRPLFRAARELGAFYRAALADELQSQGYEIDAGSGRGRRYFEIAGVSEELREAMSGRSREVWLAAERFRARYGRAPERDELRGVKLQNRRAKVPQTRPELQAAWDERARALGVERSQIEQVSDDGQPGDVRREHRTGFEQRVTDSLTAEAATFSQRELRATVLEQGVGERSPEQLSVQTRGLIRGGAVVELSGGRMTTREVRDAERAVIERAQAMASTGAQPVSEQARTLASQECAERIGALLGDEQHSALRALTGTERIALLVGQAGAGKGVVIDAAARAEQRSGRKTFGVAVSGSTAERLGEVSPALDGKTMTVDSFVARARAGTLELGEATTVYFDEAGMADTRRLDELTQVISEKGAKLVLIGDSRQLPAIGAGGLFATLSEITPTASLSEVRRTEDPDERGAWADLRAGRAERAMAHYQARGQLHFADTRDEALERAVKQWAELSERDGVGSVALMSDASNVEIDRMNARAQHLRAERGELGETRVELPQVPYGLRAGDRVCFISQHRVDGERRIENGTLAEVIDVDRDHECVTVRTGGAREIAVERDDLSQLRLAYAQHLYRQQGATVSRAVVLTGGWQSSHESAYVEASRARAGTDWHVAREDLGQDGLDAERVSRLAELMRTSRAQIPSLAFGAATYERELSQQLERLTARRLARDDEALEHRAGMTL